MTPISANNSIIRSRRSANGSAHASQTSSTCDSTSVSTTASRSHRRGHPGHACPSTVHLGRPGPSTTHRSVDAREFGSDGSAGEGGDALIRVGVGGCRLLRAEGVAAHLIGHRRAHEGVTGLHDLGIEIGRPPAQSRRQVIRVTASSTAAMPSGNAPSPASTPRATHDPPGRAPPPGRRDQSTPPSPAARRARWWPCPQCCRRCDPRGRRWSSRTRRCSLDVFRRTALRRSPISRVHGSRSRWS